MHGTLLWDVHLRFSKHWRAQELPACLPVVSAGTPRSACEFCSHIFSKIQTILLNQWDFQTMWVINLIWGKVVIFRWVVKLLAREYSVWDHSLEKRLLEIVNTKTSGPLYLTRSFICQEFLKAMSVFWGVLCSVLGGLTGHLWLAVVRGGRVKHSFGLTFFWEFALKWLCFLHCDISVIHEVSYTCEISNIQNMIEETDTISVWHWKLQYWDNHLHHTHLKNSSHFRHEIVVLASLNKTLLWFALSEEVKYFFLKAHF